MQSKAALALALDRVWCVDWGFAERYLQALQMIPADAMLREPGIDAYRASRLDPNAFTAGAVVPQSDTRRPYAIVDGVAIIELTGPLLQSVPSLEEGTSTIFARRQVRMASVDDAVKEIVLAINSPGGQAAGLGPLADDVREASRLKPTVASVSSIGASAAYWVASQCGSIVASPYASVGSIGVYTLLIDDVRFWDGVGVGWTLVTSGGIKGKWATGQPVDDELVEDAQREVDAVMSDFVRAVASGRGFVEAEVRKMGTGHCWRAEEAMRLGLVDGIGSEDDVLSGLMAARAATETMKT